MCDTYYTPTTRFARRRTRVTVARKPLEEEKSSVAVKSMKRRSPAAQALVMTAALLMHAQHGFAQSPPELKRMSLEQLMTIEITTVSRAPEAAMLVPAAVFVITQDDIRRSGATSLPEVLRLAPGIHVARIDSARWAIGMRGFGDRLARSILVLIDGRAVYSPLFAGTY
jgi:iron complex outermembrane recepter protein